MWNMMKRIFIVLILLLSCLGSLAQVQQGIVKTRGRLQEDGSYMPGNRIPDAVVSIKDGNDYISNHEGEFAFAVSAHGNYRISKVSKDGYSLTDMDVLLLEHECIKEPIYILLESDKEWHSYRLAIERKVRTNYQNMIYAMQDELERLRQEGEISQDELIRKQREIDKAWDNAERYVSEMSEKYLRIDYDYEEEFYHQIGNLVLNGEFERADSMLLVKGNLVDRVNKGLVYQDVIDRYNEENIKLCDYKCDILAQLNKQDSVAFYLELKASLDKRNIGWQLDAINHRAFFLYDYDTALNMLDNVLQTAMSDNDLMNTVPQIYCAKGDIYREVEKYEDAMTCYEHAMSHILQQNNEIRYLENFKKKGYVPSSKKWNMTRPELIPIYTGMANCLTELSVRRKGYNDKYVGIYGTNYAFDLYCLAIIIAEHLYGEDSYMTAKAYYEFLSWQTMLRDFTHSKKLGKKIIDILVKTDDHAHLLASTYLLIGEAYADRGRYVPALEYTEKAHEVFLSINTELDPDDISSLLATLGYIHLLKKDYDSSTAYYLSAIERKSSKYGENSIKMATLYNNTGYAYAKADDKDKALYYLNKSHKLRMQYLGEDNVFTNITDDNIKYVEKYIRD